MPEYRVPDSSPPVTLAYDLIPGRSDAPVLVYCHGLLSCRTGTRAEMIRGWCERKAWTLLAFDFQGRGDSSGSVENLTFTQQIQDLDAILDVLPGGTRPVLFGSSLGGLTAAWYAALHPGRVRACVLVAPAFSIVAGILADIGLTGMQQWRQEDRRQFEGDREGLVMNHGFVEDAADYPEALLYSSFRTPTLVVHGMKDETIPFHRSVEFVNKVPSGLADLHLFAEGDHQIHDFMEEVLTLMETFVGRRAPE